MKRKQTHTPWVRLKSIQKLVQRIRDVAAFFSGSLLGSGHWLCGFHPWRVPEGTGYPLVKVDIANWKDPPCIVGKNSRTFRPGHVFISYVELPEGR